MIVARSGNSRVIKVHKCSACGRDHDEVPITVSAGQSEFVCPTNGKAVFVDFGPTEPRKKCGCGREFSVHEFLALPQPKRGDVQFSLDETGAFFTVMRNCICGSTICVEARVTDGLEFFNPQQRSKT